jgi:hypothetical protein
MMALFCRHVFPIPILHLYERRFVRFLFPGRKVNQVWVTFIPSVYTELVGFWMFLWKAEPHSSYL